MIYCVSDCFYHEGETTIRNKNLTIPNRLPKGLKENKRTSNEESNAGQSKQKKQRIAEDRCRRANQHERKKARGRRPPGLKYMSLGRNSHENVGGE